VIATFAQTTTYLVSGAADGAPSPTITATSTSPGAGCSGGGCRVITGSSVTLTAPDNSPGVVFNHWGGSPGCDGGATSAIIANVTADVSCTAYYTPLLAITISVTGGPASTTITPTSSTPKAVFTVGSCGVPSGGSVTATAPSLTNWHFNGWMGSVVSANPTLSFDAITASQAVTANYINQRQAAFVDQALANAVSAPSTVTINHTTAGGWSTPSACVLTCKPDYCQSSGFCSAAYVDVASYTGGASSYSLGCDNFDPPHNCSGQGRRVTSPTTTPMDRFGFNFADGFQFLSDWTYATAPSTLKLDRRDAAGNVTASYTTTVDPSFHRAGSSGTPRAPISRRTCSISSPLSSPARIRRR
jgi:hypothetical protein